MKGPVLSVRGLGKVYADGTEALRGVDLDLSEGMLGLLGPNGAGKTTFLSLVTLGLQPTSGERRYGELDAGVPRHRAAIRRRLGYLPQRYEPLPDLTGREYLRLCARLRGVSEPRRALDRRIERLLEALDLFDVSDRRAGTYSGGTKRRLGIAQALVHDPGLVVVDEPTAGLDPEERIRFRHLVTEVAEGTPVVLSTHILEDVEATCPRLVVIDHGLLLFDGSPTELLRRVDGRLWELPADRAVPSSGRLLGQRTGRDGEPIRVVVSQAPPPGGRRRAANLEDAYGYFLQSRGEVVA